jgi:hypothetical protein
MNVKTIEKIEQEAEIAIVYLKVAKTEAKYQHKENFQVDWENLQKALSRFLAAAYEGFEQKS